MPSTLAIVLFTRNVAWSTILRCADPCPFFSCHNIVGVRSILHAIDPILLPVESTGLSSIELPTGNSLVDTLFLIHLSLVNHRSFRLSIDETVHQ
jgi:hypothetical protein